MRAESALQRFRVADGNPLLPRPGMYGLFCCKNSKWYIGISQNVAMRIKQHAQGRHGPKLKRAIAVHGASSFVVVALYYSINGTVELPEIEAQAIADFDAINNGYNIISAYGGVGPYGQEFADIIRRSAATPEARAKRAAATRRRMNDPAIRAKQSEIAKKHLADPEFKRRRQEAIDTANATAETKARRKAAATRLLNDPAYRKRHREAVRIATCKPEYKDKLSAALKAFAASEEGIRTKKEAWIKRKAREFEQNAIGHLL